MHPTMHLIVNIGVVDFLLFGLLLLGIDFEGQTIWLYRRHLHYVHLVSGLVCVCVCVCIQRERERQTDTDSAFIMSTWFRV